MVDLSGLNPPQREATLTTSGPLLILAGAGSGKTRVLTHRIAHLIDQGVAPWRIMAITFTNKAAREMRERVMHLCGAQAGDVWISTFHASCARILRRDIDKLGIKGQFSIYDDDDQMSLIRSLLKERNYDDKTYVPRVIKSIISDAKNKLMSPTEWLKQSDGDMKSKIYFEIYQLYEKRLRKNDALDFDDLLVKTLELLTQHPPVLEYYRNRFQYIHVDEYQDTNMAQYEFVRLLGAMHRNVCVVGDDDQSIYGWRGADVRNILEFEKEYPDAHIIKLEQNYRSTGTILGAANEVISNNGGRKEKSLWTDRGDGERISLYCAQDERDEAAYVCAQLVKLRKAGLDYGSAAVLYRANAQSRALEEALVRVGIPYRVYGGMKFYDRKEVKDLVAYLRVLANPEDDVSLRRIINVPRRAIGDATLDQAQRYALDQEISLLAAVLSYEELGLASRARNAMAQFAALMSELVGLRYELSAEALIEAIIERTGFMKMLEQDKSDEGQSRIENVNEFIGAVKQYEQQSPDGGLEGFLENVALVSDIDSLEEKTQALTLMTLHSAKGLEFPAVFMVGLEEGIFPISRAAFGEPEQLEEERRLCYVGITRAMRKLYMTRARMRMLYGNRQSAPASRFLSEIPARLIEDANIRRMPGGSARLPAAGGTASRESRSPRKRARDTEGGALDIPGVSKGFVPSAARDVGPVQIFHIGDKVENRAHGRGVVVDIEGDSQWVVVLFDTCGRKTFQATTPHLIKVGG